MVEKKTKKVVKEKTTEAKEESKHSEKQKGGSVSISKRNLWIVGILAVLIVVGFMYQSSNSDVAAVVDGDEITISELDRAYDTLPTQYKAVTTKSDLLNQLVQTKVFYQEASSQGVMADEEARQQVELLKSSSGMDEAQFATALEQQGLTETALLDQYEKQIVVQKYLDTELISKIVISEEEVSEYYDQNPALFEKGESVIVRHILIGDEDLSPAERKEKAAILIAGTTRQNFCEKVKEYTTDVASAETCGEYAFTPEDPLVEGFKELSFKQANGQIGMVDTEFGTHIIWTVEKFPARTVGLEEASSEIENQLKNEKATVGLQEFYEELAQDKKIKIKFEEL